MLKLMKNGFAAGIAMFLAITMHAPACMGSEGVSYDPPISCTNTAGLDAQTAAFVDLQCGIQAQLFPGSSDTTVVFQIEELIYKPGSYDITGVAGQAGKIVADWVEATKILESDDPAVGAVMSGFQCSIVIGHLVTDDGSAPVLCFCYSFKEVGTGTPHFGLMVAQRLTEHQVAERVMELRLAAGPRFVDSATGASYGLYDTMPGVVTAASANASDLSTIYCTFVPGPNQDGDIDATVDCVTRQWRIYQDARTTCGENLQLAIRAAGKVFAAAVALCIARSLLAPPPFNFAAAAGCALAAAVFLVIALDVAHAVFEGCMRAATRSFKTNMINNCDLVVYEM